MLNVKEVSTVREALMIRVISGGALGLIIAFLINRLDKFNDAVLPLTVTAIGTIGLTLFLIWAGAGVMRRLTLLIWIAVAALITCLLVHYNVQVHQGRGPTAVSFLLWPPLLFIAHELLSSADLSRRYIAPYPTYFDEAWKRGLQLIAALIFTVLFWAIVGLGALLLGLIGLDWLSDLLTNSWFNVPATAIAIGAGFHLTDVSTRLLSTLRAFVLNVLSWLLLVMVVIGVIFVAGLAVKGLEPLWDTNAATMTLVCACVMLVLLINAAYQQGEGDEARTIPPVLKIAVRVASALLLIFSILAVYSLWLRVAQYGLTPHRVMAAAAVIIALLFGIGYGVAAVRRKGRWMEGLERVNIGMAFVKVAMFVALLSPLADPARLSVDDQVGRLTEGKVTADTFDWGVLAYNTGVYGRNALVKLSESEDAAIAVKAAGVLKNGAIREFRPTMSEKPDLSKLKVVYPVGAVLPVGFADADWSQDFSHECLRDAAKLDSCFAVMKDIDGDGKDEVFLANTEADGTNRAYVTLAHQRDGVWHTVGFVMLTGKALDTFRNGDITVKAVPTYQITAEDQSMQVTLSE